MDELAELDIEVIALDCTNERYDGLEIQDFIRQVKENIRINLMADTSTLKRE